jgi:hypothetical protein
MDVVTNDVGSFRPARMWPGREGLGWEETDGETSGAINQISALGTDKYFSVFVVPYSLTLSEIGSGVGSEISVIDARWVHGSALE